eukprot:RCo028362
MAAPRYSARGSDSAWVVQCDFCLHSPLTTFFHCVQCENYDLCEQCFGHSQSIHDPTHTFVQTITAAAPHSSAPPPTIATSSGYAPVAPLAVIPAGPFTTAASPPPSKVPTPSAHTPASPSAALMMGSSPLGASLYSVVPTLVPSVHRPPAAAAAAVFPSGSSGGAYDGLSSSSSAVSGLAASSWAGAARDSSPAPPPTVTLPRSAEVWLTASTPSAAQAGLQAGGAPAEHPSADAGALPVDDTLVRHPRQARTKPEVGGRPVVGLSSPTKGPPADRSSTASASSGYPFGPSATSLGQVPANSSEGGYQPWPSAPALAPPPSYSSFSAASRYEFIPPHQGEGLPWGAAAPSDASTRSSSTWFSTTSEQSTQQQLGTRAWEKQHAPPTPIGGSSSDTVVPDTLGRPSASLASPGGRTEGSAQHTPSMDSALARLMELGFAATLCREALELSGGDLHRATEYLLTQSGDSRERDGGDPSGPSTPPQSATVPAGS